MADDLDRELARRFEELRRDDDSAAPSFRKVLDRRRARGRRRRRRLRLANVLEVAAALAVLSVALYLAKPSLSTVHLGPAIAAWQSPTSSLLETPGREMLTGRPSLEIPEPGWVDAGGRAGETAPPVSTPPDPSHSPPPPLEKGAAS